MPTITYTPSCSPSVSPAGLVTHLKIRFYILLEGGDNAVNLVTYSFRYIDVLRFYVKPGAPHHIHYIKKYPAEFLTD